MATIGGRFGRLPTAAAPQVGRVAQCQKVRWQRPAARRVPHGLSSQESLPWPHHTPDRERQQQAEHREVDGAPALAIATPAALVGLHERVFDNVLLCRQRRTALLLGERGGHRVR